MTGQFPAGWETPEVQFHIVGNSEVSEPQAYVVFPSDSYPAYEIYSGPVLDDNLNPVLTSYTIVSVDGPLKFVDGEGTGREIEWADVTSVATLEVPGTGAPEWSKVEAIATFLANTIRLNVVT
jgi:hypothetical protein